ncbi:hypothetical protein A7985_04655 [Pseudoalteromonas luteoviolacea]|uniref:DUF3080 domain-containing protein n=1 Tax=Pseudoalteromonas luteoviolacea TaxID=43657 RepID=A0A1C0TV93_9GAMM|nr:DUF3080 family protein [Pseudoalteromonas luteoviolacea]MBQ4809793.1 DUF3080 family protein [Pseudoalteromonas luteoviolacea]OCQ23239.1 hypothetical protein A7985_04655 [Pseudoalteromonas luteoviolacea]
MKCKLLTAFSFILLGCTPAPSDVNEEYSERLANVIGVNKAVIEKPKAVKLQATNAPTSNYTISVIDLAKLGHCRVATHIANHNNQLGKLAKPSELFKYNVNFIRYAQACIQHKSTDDDIKVTLQQALKEKQANLPASLAHVFTNEKELTKLLSLTFEEVTIETSNGEIAAQEALSIITSLVNKLDEPALIDENKLTAALEKLNNNSYVASLLTSTQKQILWNISSTHWLSQHSLEKSICPQGKNKQKAKVLNNVFQKYYIQEIQAYQSKLAQRLHTLEPFFSTFTDKFGKDLYPNPISPLLNELKLTAKQHVFWWQTFYKVCKVKPL